jgi:Sugar (and other) transporter
MKALPSCSARRAALPDTHFGPNVTRAAIVLDFFSGLHAGQAVSAAMGTHWVCNFAIGQLFLPAVTKFGVSTVYLAFAAVCAAAVLFVQKFIVETKGKSLEQIELELA